jgi:hypothetical protein
VPERELWCRDTSLDVCITCSVVGRFVLGVARRYYRITIVPVFRCMLESGFLVRL